MADNTNPQDRPIVTRAQAKAAGAKRYFNRKPCPAGHVAERMTSSGACVTCLHDRRDAWRAANPEKTRAAKAAHYAANREASLAYAIAYQAAHVEEIRAKSAEYRIANLDKVRAWYVAWCNTHPEKLRSYVANRRALKLQAGGKHTANDIKELFKLQRGKCAHPWCGKQLTSGYHVDHVLPLVLGGSNGRNNLQILCQRCNQTKRAAHPIDFAQRHGMLL